jgi:WD40 repeat protein
MGLTIYNPDDNASADRTSQLELANNNTVNGGHVGFISFSRNKATAKICAQIRATSDSAHADAGAYLRLFTKPSEGSLTERVRLSAAGDFGIAMTPGGSHKLDVTGSAGLSTGTAWTNTSDPRIKKDVATITGATAKLKQLRPISYKYTDQYLSVHDEIDGSKTYHSFVADEYETVFPDAVSVQGDLVKTTQPTYYADGDDLPDGKSAGDEKTPEISEKLLTDLKQYTPHDLQMFLTAAIQELDARVVALEAA